MIGPTFLWMTRLQLRFVKCQGLTPSPTDGTFLSAWEGIPILTLGAGKWMIPHQKDEWVSVEDLYLTAKIYAVSAMEFLGETES